MSRHLPSILGCAIGFCAAGCGVGSLVGMWIGHLVFPELPDGQTTQQEQVTARYGGICWGMPVGMLLGTIGGIVYAVLVRRSRQRKPGADS